VGDRDAVPNLYGASAIHGRPRRPVITETAHVEQLYQAARAVAQAHARYHAAQEAVLSGQHHADGDTRRAFAALVVARRTLDTTAHDLREVLGLPAEIQPGELLASTSEGRRR